MIGQFCINLTNRGIEASVRLLFLRMRDDKVPLAATDSHNSSAQASVSDNISRLQRQNTDTVTSSDADERVSVILPDAVGNT